jgi:polysaccharide export outer membrane protein
MCSTAGCGVTYNSQSVSERQDGSPVSVVPLSASTAQQANTLKYQPRALPAAFFHAAPAGGSAVGFGALPASPQFPDLSRKSQVLRPLPDIPKPTYRIGVGDVVLLATPKVTNSVAELSGLLAAQNQRQGYAVRDDGTISIPDVGAIVVAGLTVKQAEDALFKLMISKQIDPTFSLEVAEFNSQRVVIGGAVNNAALVPITLNGLTLAEALVAAGGLNAPNTEFATIRIYRDGNLYEIPLELYLKQPEQQNKRMRDGDAIYVDLTYDLDRAFEFYKSRLDVISLRGKLKADALEALTTEIQLQRAAYTERRSLFELRTSLGAEKRDYVYLTGEVNKQNRFALPFEQQSSLADVLFSEGGYDITTGDPSQIYVLRETSDAKPAGPITAYHLDARNAADLVVATKLEMRPNDVIFIEEQPITKWNRALQQLFPVLVNTATSSVGK